MSSWAFVMPWKSHPSQRAGTNRALFRRERRASKALLRVSWPRWVKTRHIPPEPTHGLAHEISDQLAGTTTCHAKRANSILGNSRGRLRLIPDRRTRGVMVEVFPGIPGWYDGAPGPFLRGQTDRERGRRRCGIAPLDKPRGGSRCPSRSCPRAGSRHSDTNTMKPGRSRLSEPRP